MNKIFLFIRVSEQRSFSHHVASEAVCRTSQVFSGSVFSQRVKTPGSDDFGLIELEGEKFSI